MINRQINQIDTINRWIRRKWPLFMKGGDIVAFLILILLMYWTTTVSLDNNIKAEDRRSFVVAVSGLVLSILAVYITTMRPFLKKPRLAFSLDTKWSEPTESNDSGSWFYRLRVENYGLTKATNCMGRLIEVQTEEGDPIVKFDPLPLYWTRQSRIKVDGEEETTFKPIDIQGYMDFDFLDIAQVKGNSLTLRVVIPPLMTLTHGPTTSASPGIEPALKLPGTYYIRIGLYADDISASPILMKIVCLDFPQSLNSTNSPCKLKVV